MVLKKQGKNIMQTNELIGSGGCHGASQAYGVIHYLDDSLLYDYSFPVKNFTTKLFPTSFLECLRGHKDNISAAKKTLNKIWCKMSKECIKFPKFTKYQKTQKESY
jgi:hypothetical protein